MLGFLWDYIIEKQRTFSTQTCCYAGHTQRSEKLWTRGQRSLARQVATPCGAWLQILESICPQFPLYSG